MTIHAAIGPNEQEAARLFREIFSMRAANNSAAAPWANFRSKVSSMHDWTNCVAQKSSLVLVGDRCDDPSAAIRVPDLKLGDLLNSALSCVRFACIWAETLK